MLSGATRNKVAVAVGLSRSKRITTSRGSHSSFHTSSSVRKEVFGIDFGNKITRVAVVDPATLKPHIVKNVDDGTDFWHNAVAYDSTSSQFIVGKRAKQLVYSGNVQVAHRFKPLIGARYGGAELKKYTKQFGAFVARVSRGDNDSIQLKLSGGQRLSATEIAAEVFKSIRRACDAHIKSESSDPIEAYITVPASFTDDQRDAIVSAASLAGINIVQLVEEPIAALYGVRRLEHNGNYHFVDFGDSIRSYLVRVIDGKADVIASTHREYKDLAETIQKAQQAYIVDQTRRKIGTEDFSLLLSEQINDALIESAEWVPEDSSIRSKVNYFSRESRQLRTFEKIQARTAFLTQDLEKSLSTANVAMSEITHPVLIGGGSMAFPEVARMLEKVHQTRLADLVAPADRSTAVGLAILAAEGRGQLKTVLAGKRSLDSKGRPVSTTKNAIDTYLQEYKFAQTFMKGTVNMPSPVPFSYENMASVMRVDPLYPEYRSDENPKRPEAAVSYAQKHDPLSGKVEHWARVTIKAPELPKEEIERPDLKIVFVLNLTASPAIDASLDVPNAESIHDWESYVAAMKAAGVPNAAEKARAALQSGNSAGFEAAARAAEKKAKLYILKKIQEMKDANGAFFRVQNRAIEAVQTIMSQLDKRRDFVGVVAVGGGKGGASQTINSLPLQRMFHQDNEQVIRSLKYFDISGRASERYVDVIRQAHNAFSQHNDSPLPDPDLPPPPPPGEYDYFHMSPAETEAAIKAQEPKMTEIQVTVQQPTEEGKEGQKDAAPQPTPAAEEEKKEKKKPARTEKRIVMITDSPPDASIINEVESALVDATKDDVLTTIVSIDGPLPEGSYNTMQTRVRGMRTLRWYRKNVHTHAFRNQWLTHKDLIQKYFTEQPFRSVVANIEFDRYNILKMYGGNLTPKERLRMERKATKTVRVKYASIDCSYPHEQVDHLLDWSQKPDTMSILFKLEPETTETLFERELRLQRDAGSAPKQDSSLSTFVSNDFTPQSKLKMNISYLDVSGEKREYERGFWLADNSVPGYADENGIEDLIWAAKFSDFFKTSIHSTLAAPLGDSVLALPAPSSETGIPYLSQKLEDQLLQNYAADSSECVLLMAQALERRRAGLGPLTDQQRQWMDSLYHKYMQSRIKQYWFDGNHEERRQSWEKDIENDPIVSIVWAFREAFYGQPRPKTVVSVWEKFKLVRQMLAERKKIIAEAEKKSANAPALFESVLKYRGDGDEVINERENFEGQYLDLMHRINKTKHVLENDYDTAGAVVHATFLTDDYDTMWKHMRKRVEEMDKEIRANMKQKQDALKAYLSGAAEAKYNPLDGRPENIVAYTAMMLKHTMKEEAREDREWRQVIADRKRWGTYKLARKPKPNLILSKKKKKRSRKSRKAKKEATTEEDNFDLPQTEEEIRAAAEAEDRAEAAEAQREKERHQRQVDTYERLLRRKLVRAEEMNDADKAEILFGGRHRPIDIVDYVKRWGEPTIGRTRAEQMLKRPVFALFYEKDPALRKGLAFRHYLTTRAMFGLPEQMRQQPPSVPGPKLLGLDRFVLKPRFRGVPAWNLAPETVTTDELEGHAIAYLKHGIKSVLMDPHSWVMYEKQKPRREWETRSYLAWMRGEEFTEPPPENMEPVHFSGYDRLPLRGTDEMCIPPLKRRELLHWVQEQVPPLTHPRHLGAPIRLKDYYKLALEARDLAKPDIAEECYQTVAKYRADWIPKRIASLRSQISWLKNPIGSGAFSKVAKLATRWLGLGNSLANSMAEPIDSIDAKIAAYEAEIAILQDEYPKAQKLHQIVVVEKSMAATDAMRILFPDRFEEERTQRVLREAEKKLKEDQRQAKLAELEMQRIKRLENKPDLPKYAVPPRWLLRRWRKKMSQKKWNKTVSRVQKLYKARKALDQKRKEAKAKKSTETPATTEAQQPQTPPESTTA